MTENNHNATMYEVTVNRGTGAEVIDVEAESPNDAERIAGEREDVNRVISGCTVEYERNEQGERVY